LLAASSFSCMLPFRFRRCEDHVLALQCDTCSSCEPRRVLDCDPSSGGSFSHLQTSVKAAEGLGMEAEAANDRETRTQASKQASKHSSPLLGASPSRSNDVNSERESSHTVMEPLIEDPFEGAWLFSQVALLTPEVLARNSCMHACIAHEQMILSSRQRTSLLRW